MYGVFKVDKNTINQKEELRNEIIEGRNAVIEALRAGRAIDKIFINKGEVDKTLGHIASKARDKGIVISFVSRERLGELSASGHHQGVIARAAAFQYSAVGFGVVYHVFVHVSDVLAFLGSSVTVYTYEDAEQIGGM